MTPQQRTAADLLWAAYEAADGRPSALPDEVGVLFADLGFEDGLAVQADILARRLARGDHQVGWKVGLTSERARKLVGIDDRPFGHLMHLVDSGATVRWADSLGPSIEPELCFTAGERIAGPDVTPEQVRGSLSRAAAGYELNERRTVVGQNMALLIGDNLTNWAIAEGGGCDPGQIHDIDATEIVVSCNGEERFRCTSRDEVDTPYLSIARLAATLDRHGLAIEAGHKIITGAYCRFDASPGDTWTTDYSGLGRVEITYS